MNDRFTGLTIADYLDLQAAEEQETSRERKRAQTLAADSPLEPPPHAMSAKPWVPPQKAFRRPGSEDYLAWPSKGGD